MCGIVGIHVLGGGSPDVAPLSRMIELMEHRGPDDIGTYNDDYIALGHARLSIIDLGGGHQPMHNQDKSLWITYNGEIFNFVELRADLIRKGHRFATNCDTEVILHLYEEHGEECVHFLNGQWAFAVWDTKRRKLFLSRDRLGVRPLYYASTSRAFLFASEIKSILAYPGIRRELDLEALDQVFTFWFSLPPRTMFKNISELPPGHSLVVEDGQIRVRRYWELDYPVTAVGSDENETQERLIELLTDATRLRLRADVPVGAYLSGGLDSSIITALAKAHNKTPVKSFSVAFDDPDFDESEYQRDVAAALQTEHHEVRCSYADISAIFPEVIWHTEKPVLRTAPGPLYLLSKLVRDLGYKVVLTGEGADEILGGYDIYKETKIRRFWAADPDSRVRPILLKRLYPYLSNIQAQPIDYLKAAFQIGEEDLSNLFFSHLPRWRTTAQSKVFFSDDVKSQLGGYSCYKELEQTLPAGYRAWDDFCRAQYLETKYLLPGYILSSQGDRVAMGHSVEGRFPFLDYRLVEFCNTIPPRLKMKVLNEKYILKRAAGHLVPLSVRQRAKRPYRAPEAASFFDSAKGAARQEYVDDLLSERTVAEFGVFSPLSVRKLVEKAKGGRLIGIKDNMALTGIISTQLFLKQFMTSAYAAGVANADFGT